MFGFLIKALVFTVVVFSSAMGIGVVIDHYSQNPSVSTNVVSPTNTPIPIETPKPVNKGTPQFSANIPDWSVKKIDNVVTSANYPADTRMGTPDELFEAVNNFRVANSINPVVKHDTLCRIAQARADKMLADGKASHDGMEEQTRSQHDFEWVGEILEGGSKKRFAVHTVEWGWARSLTGHREALLNRSFTHGCGGVAGTFVAFIFGHN